MSQNTPHGSSYDVVIVGAGIAGSAFAHALSAAALTSRAAPLRIALLERSLAEPDRIVGELLQPAGVAALRSLGLGACLDDIDAVPVHGYAVLDTSETVHIPYPCGAQGRSFHHGRFVQNLRAHAKAARAVDVIEATVTNLIECPLTRRVIGVRARREGAEQKESFFADLVVVADGCFSNFRGSVMEGSAISKRSVVRGNFVGAVLEDVSLPIPQHGTVALVKGHGPVLLYQISEHDTRILIDVKNPLPSDLKVSKLQLRPFAQRHVISQVLLEHGADALADANSRDDGNQTPLRPVSRAGRFGLGPYSCWSRAGRMLMCETRAELPSSQPWRKDIGITVSVFVAELAN